MTLAQSYALAARLQDLQMLLFAASLAVLLALESMPALRSHAPEAGRTGVRWRNVVLWIGGVAIMSFIAGGVLVPLMLWLEANRIGLLFAFDLPWWATLAVGVLVLDGADYLFHRLSHEVRWLWCLHAVHHSDASIDTTTNLRVHPLHLLVTVLWRVAVLAAFGLPLWMVVLRELVATPIAQWHHANVRLPAALDRVLRRVIVTPGMHRLHHSSVQRETDSNYSAVLSFWDRLFGTYTEVRDAGPSPFGLARLPRHNVRTLRGILATPWTIARRREPV